MKGKTKHYLYNTWRAMIHRCHGSSNHPDWKHYGGRGIKVCSRWRNSFKTFLEDMGDRPKGYSLDRINPNGNYEPTNCRWASKVIQRRNQRDNLINKITTADVKNIVEMYNNEMTTVQIAKLFNTDAHFICGVILGAKLSNNNLPKNYSFKEITLIPQKNICESRLDTNIQSEILREVYLDIPLIAANMNSVCNASFCTKLDKLGSMGILHRAGSNEELILETKKLANNSKLVAVSIGIGKDQFKLVKKFIDVGANIIVIDIANGYTDQVINLGRKIKKEYNVKLILGNTVNSQMLYEVDDFADAVKIGIGQGFSCETALTAAHTIGQFSAVYRLKEISKKLGLPIISDGGIREPADFVKAIAGGANSVMAGSIFAKCPESAGKIIELADGTKKKIYAGMASRYVQNTWKGGIKNGTCPEGNIKYLDLGESVEKLLERYAGALRSGITYSSAKNIKELQENAQFERITPNYF